MFAVVSFVLLSLFGSQTPTVGADNVCAMISVVDGDTITVSCGEENYIVRLIGIDTPEKGMYGYDYPKQFLEIFLRDKELTLSADLSKPDQDMFGRKLRYVTVDGIDIGYTLIKIGFAKEFQYDVKYEQRRRYKAAELAAVRNEIGIWNHYQTPFASDCYIDSTSISHGSSQLFFAQQYVHSIDVCQSEIRVCHDGLLSGSFRESTCMLYN